MKKGLVLILALICAFGIQSFAADSITVYVSIANGELEMARQAVNVTDSDADGVLTINDALYCAHEKAYEGGAAGYASVKSDYGVSMTRLWGVENGGSYNYFVNNDAVMSLVDPVSDGDYVYAFVYTDTSGFSDSYCYFDVESLSVSAGDSISLTVLSAKYDENWNLVKSPVSGAIITLDGVSTAVVSDVNGKAEISIADTGTHIISATSDSAILVPPVCIAEVGITSPQTSDYASICTIIGIIALAAYALTRRSK